MLDGATLEEWVARIRTTFDPDRIVLFGSYASGTAGPESDVDLLVVMRSAERRDARQEAVSRLLRPRRVPVDVLVYTPDEVAVAKTRAGSFLGEILARGRILYERSS